MTYQEAVGQAFGEAATFDPEILRSYDHDLGEMPRPLMALIAHRPHTVVVPRTAADVAQALAIADRYDVPVTPRGQASSGYGGAMACQGGMVLDLCGLNRVLAVDPAAGTVDVEPGLVWEELSRALAGHGLDNRVCPTSAPSSTVGGWFAMGGVGIGSLRYGDIRDNLLEIDVAGLDGTIRTHAGSEMDAFHQTCGALGVITRLRLACRPAEALTPLAVGLPDAARAVRFLELLEPWPAAYSASLLSAGYCAMRAAADGHAPAALSGYVVSLAATGPGDHAAEAARLAARCGGELLDAATGQAEWDGRYYPMRIRRVGPSALVGEFYVPLAGFAPAVAALSKALWRDALGVEAFAVRGGRLAVLVYLLDDADSLLYPLRMAKAMVPLILSRRYGGAPYATGMWFSALAEAVFGRDKLARVRRLKTELDPRELLNPGNLGGPWLPLLPCLSLSRLIVWATACIGPLAALFPSPRRRSS